MKRWKTAGLLLFLVTGAFAQTSKTPGGGGSSTIVSGASTTCATAGGVWRTSSPAATLDCGTGLTYNGTTFAVTGAATLSGITTTTAAGNAFGAIDAASAVNRQARFTNLGGDVAFGVENSAGTGFGITGGVAYSAVMSAIGARPIVLATNSVARVIIDSAGEATVGSSSITGTTKALTATSVSGPDLHAGIPSKTLVSGAITTFATMALGNDTGGCTTLWYTVYAGDATTAGTEGGQVTVCGTDVTSGAGGESCTASAVFGNVQDLQGSTLTVAFAASAGTDLCNIRVTATTDIGTPTSLYIKWGALAGGRTITPQ